MLAESLALTAALFVIGVIGVLVHRETGGSVLDKEHNQAFAGARFFQLLLNLIRELDQFFALIRTNFENVHSGIVA